METLKTVPRIESLTIKNYRALKHLQLRNITPLTVFLGPNGSGKSTLFDVFAFLSECFSIGLRKAWDKRGRMKELRTRNSDGPIEIELKYREKPGEPLIIYYISFNEKDKGPFVEQEYLRWKKGSAGAPYYFLNFHNSKGWVISGEKPDREADRISEELDSPELIAVNTLGQFQRHPRVSSLRRFITSWYLSYLTADNTRTTPEAGPQEHLSTIGDNLPNVIQYFKEQKADLLMKIFHILSTRIPRIRKVETEIMQDGRLLLEILDAPFERPILSKFASDGTLKMLAYLTVLLDPNPPQLIGIEEPENHLHPRILPALTEECREASADSQLFISTHSPHLIRDLRPPELWVLARDKKGFTQAKCVKEMEIAMQMFKQGINLGDLWMENYFDIGDPLFGNE